MPEINDIPEQQAPATGGDPRRALYDKLHQAEYYTKSYDEFNKKYSDSASREKLYSVLNQEGFYTKSKQDFDSKYFSDQQEKPSTERSMMPVKAPGWNFANQVIDQAQRLTSGDEPQTDDHAKEVQQATKTVQNAWGDIDRTAKNHILYTEDMDKGAQAQAPISDNTTVSRQLPPLLRQREEEARKNAIPTDQVEALKADPNQTGTLLNLKKVELQREGKHQEANDLQAAAYALDSQDRATGDKKEKIQKNIQDLKKGELVYNARTGDLVRHAGIFESIKIGHENRNKAYQGGLDIMGASKDDRIKMAEKELNDKDPDDPVPSPSSVWSTVGSEGMMFAKGALGALAGGSLTSSPLGAAAGYTAMTSDEVAGRAVHDEYMRTYPQVKSELSKQHPEMSDAEINNIADDKAYQLAKVAGLTGGVTNAALSLTGGSALAETVNAADKPLVGGFTRRALSTAENVLKGIAKDSKEKLPSGLLTAGVAGGGELVKGEMANRIGVKRDAGSEALGAAEQMLVFHHVMVAAGHAIGGARRLLTSSLSKQPPGVIAQAAHDAVLDGTLSSGQAKDLLNDVAQQNVRDAQIPAHVTDPQARLEIQDKMDKYDDLKKQLGKPEEGGLHEAHHPIIKDLMGRTEWEINMLAAKPEEQIKILKDKQTELKNNLEAHNEAKRSGEAGKLEYPDADRAQLSDVERRIKDVQEKVDSPLYKAAKIIKEGNTKGFSKDVLEQAADDPEELNSYLKDISEQSHDPNSREATIDTYGEDLVNLAEQIHPKEVTRDSEPNPSGVTFKTAKGSDYIVHEDGTTSRNKAKRPEHGEDFGKKERSKTTLYVHPDDVSKAETIYAAGHAARAVERNGDVARIRSLMHNGRIDIQEFRVSDKPTVGWHPFEILKNGYHLGNAITEVNEPKTPSRISVVRPEENKSANVIPLKAAPKETTTAPHEMAEAVREEPPVEPPTSTTAAIHVERPQTEISMRGLQDVANEFGLEDIQKRDRKTDIRLKKDAENTIGEWVKKGEYNKNVEELITHAEKKGVLTDEERVILENHLASLREDIRKVDPRSSEYDQKLEGIERIVKAGEATRSAAGAALRLPAGSKIAPRSLEDFFIEEKQNTGVSKLTDKQKETVIKEHETISEAQKRLEEKVKELEERNAKLEAEKVLKAEKPKKGSKKTYEQLAEERKQIVADAREKLRKARGDASVTILPYAKELIAIAPEVAKMVRNLVEEGIITIGDVAKKYMRSLNQTFQN
jgi:hypothetical protein